MDDFWRWSGLFFNLTKLVSVLASPLYRYKCVWRLQKAWNLNRDGDFLVSGGYREATTVGKSSRNFLTLNIEYYRHGIYENPRLPLSKTYLNQRLVPRRNDFLPECRFPGLFSPADERETARAYTVPSRVSVIPAVSAGNSCWQTCFFPFNTSEQARETETER